MTTSPSFFDSGVLKFGNIDWPFRATTEHKTGFSIQATMENGSGIGVILIINKKGNPGEIKIEYSNSVYKIAPGEAIRFVSGFPMRSGQSLWVLGSVHFSAPGSYAIELKAGVEML